MFEGKENTEMVCIVDELHESEKQKELLSGIPILPEVRIPWKQRAMQYTGAFHGGNPRDRFCKPQPVMKVNHRALERNKYAPWGVGVHTCLFK